MRFDHASLSPSQAMAELTRTACRYFVQDRSLTNTGWPKKNETFTLKPSTGFITGSIFLIFALNNQHAILYRMIPKTLKKIYLEGF